MGLFYEFSFLNSYISFPDEAMYEFIKERKGEKKALEELKNTIITIMNGVSA